MKTLFIASLSILLLTACGEFPPMSAAEAKAFDTCMEKGWVPLFQVTSSSRTLKCTRK